MNLKLNKQLLAMTEENTSKNMAAETSTSAPSSTQMAAFKATMETRLKGYQDREEAMQRQLDDTIKQRDEGQAQILIFE